MEIIRSLVAAGIVALCLLGLAVEVRRMRYYPMALSMAVALALLTCFETLLLNALSVIHVVTVATVLLAHLALLAVLIIRNWRTRWLRVPSAADIARGGNRVGALVSVAGLAGLVAISAIRYAPNNFDSMTYHLARVAHWIQNASVSPYPTPIVRQLVYPPGGDYLFLVLQLLSGTDRIASLLQWSCFLIVVGSAPSLARLAGTPRAFVWLAVLMVATFPMVVLQASSAQIDLVASTMGIAMVATCLPFLHFRHGVHWPLPRLLLVSVASSAAVIVKPTAFAAGIPFVFLAGTATTAYLRQPAANRRGYVKAIFAALVLVAFVCLPEMVRRNPFADAPSMTTTYVYPAFGDWNDRALNVLRGVSRHMPTPRPFATWLGTPDACPETALLCLNGVFRAHEDLAGGPIHLALAAILVVVATLGFSRVPQRARYGVAALTASWFLLHFMLRDNRWIPRQQLPLVALWPVLLAGLSGIPKKILRQQWWRGLMTILAIALLGSAYSTAVRNELRPPFGESIPYAWSYYNSYDTQMAPQMAALKMLVQRGCRRLGLLMQEESYDYPITWQAMQLGVEVRHIRALNAWPCLVYSDTDRGSSALLAFAWVPVAGYTDDAGRERPFLFAPPGNREGYSFGVPR